jgi:peroxiredoxin
LSPADDVARELAQAAAAGLISLLAALTVSTALCNFARLALAQTNPPGEGSVLSWQRPNGAAWREPAKRRIARASAAASRAGAAVRLWLVALALGGACAAPAQPSYPLIGQAAPDFALHAAAGGNVRLSEHRGEVVVLSFWSSRCAPCRTQLVALNRSFATYQSAGLAIYGVGVDDDPLQARDFARSAAVDFALLLDPAKAVSRNYQIDNLPMTVLIDRNGTVRHVLRDYSAASNGMYLRELRALLNE